MILASALSGLAPASAGTLDDLREELARINRKLVVDANTDPLTGIAKRRAFDAFAEQALIADREVMQPMSVLMLDLDKFKSVNDTYGHGAGDCVLKEMAQRWKSVIRASDMIARLGGEEFCVVLPQTTTAQAMLVAEKLRAVTAAEPVLVFQDSGDISLPVTVSIGAASSEFLMDIEIKDMMQAADEALYQAKHGGRNRVVLHRAMPGLAVAA